MSVLSDIFRSLGRLFRDDLGFIGTVGFLGLLILLGLIGYCLVNPRTRTIARHTWRAAFRFRFFWVMAILLIAAVVGMPMIIKGDGSAEGLTQILITYTLSFAFFLHADMTVCFCLLLKVKSKAKKANGHVTMQEKSKKSKMNTKINFAS